MDIFIKRLKELRKLNDITQIELAKMLGVSYSTIGQWESGRNRPTSKMLEKVAEVLNTDVNYLLGMEQTEPSELEKKLTALGYKDKINKLSPKKFEALLTLIDSLIADDNKKN